MERVSNLETRLSQLLPIHSTQQVREREGGRGRKRECAQRNTAELYNISFSLSLSLSQSLAKFLHDMEQRITYARSLLVIPPTNPSSSSLSLSSSLLPFSPIHPHLHHSSSSPVPQEPAEQDMETDQSELQYNSILQSTGLYTNSIISNTENITENKSELHVIHTHVCTLHYTCTLHKQQLHVYVSLRYCVRHVWDGILAGKRSVNLAKTVSIIS